LNLFPISNTANSSRKLYYLLLIVYVIGITTIDSFTYKCLKTGCQVSKSKPYHEQPKKQLS
jgi:hypothetical protein